MQVGFERRLSNNKVSDLYVGDRCLIPGRSTGGVFMQVSCELPRTIEANSKLVLLFLNFSIVPHPEMYSLFCQLSTALNILLHKSHTLYTYVAVTNVCRYSIYMGKVFPTYDLVVRTETHYYCEKACVLYK